MKVIRRFLELLIRRKKRKTKKKCKIITLDELTEICGFFKEDCDEKEIDDISGKEQGNCLSFACPLANALDPDDPLDLKYFRAANANPDDYKGGFDGDTLMLVWNLNLKEGKP